MLILRCFFTLFLKNMGIAEQTVMPMILGFAGILFSVMVVFVPLICFLVLLAIYNSSSSPNRVLSSILHIKAWGVAVFLIVVAVASFLANLLSSFGLTEDRFEWDLTSVRMSLILLVLGLTFGYLIKKFAKNTIFETEKDDEKSLKLYVSQIFHIILTVAFIAVSFVLAAMVLDYLLSFVLINKGEYRRDSILVSIDILSTIIPLALVFILLWPSLVKKKRFLPQIKSTAYFVLHTILMLVAILVSLVAISSVLNDFLVMTLGTYSTSILHVAKGDIRNHLVMFIISLSGFIVLWARCGGKNAFLKTK